MCAQCEQPFDFVRDGHITDQMRKNHLSSRNNKVLCYGCNNQPSMYICSRCGECGLRKAFETKHFERDCKRNTQQCLECKSGRRKGKTCSVEACKQFIKEENLSQAHKRNVTRAFVCDMCAEKGYTTKDQKTYTCSACKNVTGGHGLFQTKNFQQAAARGTQKCRGCFR